VERLLAVRGNRGQGHAVLGGPRAEAAGIAFPDARAASLDVAPALELRAQERRLQIGHQEARADVDPGVLVDLAAEEAAAVGPFFAEDLGALDERRIVDEQRAALAAGDVLGLVERLRGEGAEGAEPAAAPTAVEPVRVVLDDGQAVAARDV